MLITISRQQGRVPVTILHLDGKLDSNSFQGLIDEARQIFSKDAAHLILDMAKLTYISSAGIVSLHTIARIFRGEPVPDDDAGWKSVRLQEQERIASLQKNVILLNVPPEVQNVLDVVGFTAFFEMHTELEQAVASF